MRLQIWRKAGIRFALSAAALGALWFAARREQVFMRDLQLHFSRAFEFPSLDVPGWLAVVGLHVLVGILFGLALSLPEGRVAYRWDRTALIGVLPLAMVLAFPVTMTPSSITLTLPGFVFEHHDIAAVLLGVALGSGLEDAGDDARGEKGAA